MLKKIYNFFEKKFLSSLSKEKKFKVRVFFINVVIFVRDNTITYLRSWIFKLRYPPSYKNIFISCMPKTGSTYTHKVLQAGLPRCFQYYDAPWNDYSLTGRGLFRLKFRCSIQRLHLPATLFNIRYLRRNGVKKYVILLRDPRDVVISFYHHLEAERGEYIHLIPKYAQMNKQEKITFLIRLFLPRLINHINSWDYPYPELGSLDVLKLYYRDMISSPIDHFRKILNFYNIPEYLFDKKAADLRKKVRFRKGKVGVWREYFTEEQTELANAICGDVLMRHGWQA